MPQRQPGITDTTVPLAVRLTNFIDPNRKSIRTGGVTPLGRRHFGPIIGPICFNKRVVRFASVGESISGPNRFLGRFAKRDTVFPSGIKQFGQFFVPVRFLLYHFVNSSNIDNRRIMK